MAGTLTAQAADDAAKGRKVFAKCAICHKVGPDAGVTSAGVGLNGIVGKTIGSEPGFQYSTAMAALGAEGKVWDEAFLALFLQDPAAAVPGTRMAFAGLKRQAEVDFLLVYLRQIQPDGTGH
ncbi:c-type cytochrome [Pannonibacter phragmitetus]|nr:c-type cytochrome [Pannonibacter phragmitetus]